MALSTSLAPSANFDLTDWKITLPVDAKGGIGGTAVEQTNLSGYENETSFYTGLDGAMVFAAAVDGATTSGTKYARSELREMNGSARAAWHLDTGGYMSATLEVDKVPTLSSGAGGRVIVGQIHGQDNELVRLYWENNSLYFNNDQSGTDNKEHKFLLTDSSGKAPDVSLNEKFSYSIEAHGDTLDVKVYADGKTYESSTHINDVWQSDSFYFKAGVYLGVNETQGSGTGQTSFYALDVNHTGATPIPTVPAIPSIPSVPEGPSTPTHPTVPATPTTPDHSDTTYATTKIVNGSKGADTLSGKATNDLIQGGEGDDRLYGKLGHDVLVGGNGKDAFTFDTKASEANTDLIKDFTKGEDVIELNDSAFAKLDHGALKAANIAFGDHALDKDDYLVYDEKSGALYYDDDGSGAHGAVHVATLENHAHLTASDFIII